MDIRGNFIVRNMLIGDWIIVAILVVGSLVGFYSMYAWNGWYVHAGDVPYAIVRVEGIVVEEIRLDTTKSKQVLVSLPTGGEAILEVDAGRVRVSYDSDHVCPLQYCMKTGWIEKPGQIIVCVPNKITVSIYRNSSQDQESIDGIVY